MAVSPHFFERLEAASTLPRGSRREFLRRGGRLLVGGAVGSSVLAALACEMAPETAVAPDEPAFDHGGTQPTRTIVQVFYPEDYGPNNWDALARAIKDARLCSNANGHGAGAVGLSRGSTYDFSGNSTLNHPGQSSPYYFGYDAAGIQFIAVGSGARPILKTTALNYISVRNYDYFSDVSIRGKFYGQSLTLRDVDPVLGLGGSGQSHWTIRSCEVSGFPGYGIQGGSSSSSPFGTNNRIEYCHIHRNGVSAIGDRGRGYGGVYMGRADRCHLDRNLVEWNATNGMDTNGSYMVLYDNTCTHNGWTNDSQGDNKGITVWGGYGLVGTLLSHNTCSNNSGDGISVSLIHGASCLRVEDVDVKYNTCNNNGGNGISVGSWGCSENVRTNVFANTCSKNQRWGTELLGSGRIVDANVHWNHWVYDCDGMGCFHVSATSATWTKNDNDCRYESCDGGTTEPCSEDPTAIEC